MEDGWILSGRKVKDAERSPKIVITVKEAFEHSSNVGMANWHIIIMRRTRQNLKITCEDLRANQKIRYRFERRIQTHGEKPQAQGLAFVKHSLPWDLVMK